MKKIKNILPEQRFTKIVFGVTMIGSAFIPGGKWNTFVLGILFISAYQGYCVTGEIYKKIEKRG